MTPTAVPLPTPAELEAYLHEHIPLTRAMHARVVAVTHDHARLAAPLAPNINHRDTVFGGSAAALATLAAWSLLHARLVAARLPCRLVIQRNSMDYDQPIPDAFVATARLADPDDWARFERTLRRRGRARITAQAELHCRDRPVARFEGEFVAVVNPAAESHRAGH